MYTIPDETNKVEVNTMNTKVNNRIDEILVEQKAKGKNYADWQKEQYPVKATHTETRDYVVKRKGE